MNTTMTLQRKLADRKPHVVTFTKRDGTIRTMHAVYEGGKIRNGMMQVRDTEINEVRTINLSTVHTVWNVQPKAAPVQTVEEMCNELFY